MYIPWTVWNAFGFYSFNLMNLIESKYKKNQKYKQVIKPKSATDL
jgi:hypothetical protein